MEILKLQMKIGFLNKKTDMIGQRLEIILYPGAKRRRVLLLNTNKNVLGDRQTSIELICIFYYNFVSIYPNM